MFQLENGPPTRIRVVRITKSLLCSTVVRDPYHIERSENSRTYREAVHTHCDLCRDASSRKDNFVS